MRLTWTNCWPRGSSRARCWRRVLPCVQSLLYAASFFLLWLLSHLVVQILICTHSPLISARNSTRSSTKNDTHATRRDDTTRHNTTRHTVRHTQVRTTWRISVLVWCTLLALPLCCRGYAFVHFLSYKFSRIFRSVSCFVDSLRSQLLCCIMPCPARHGQVRLLKSV